MARAGILSLGQGHSWTLSAGMTSRMFWPLFIVAGQLSLLALAFGFLTTVRSRQLLALPPDVGNWLDDNPQLKFYIFTLLANSLSIFSSFLFTQAVRHALLVSLTRPLSVTTLGYGILISRKSIAFTRGAYKLKWVMLSAAVFVVSFGQTPGWSSLLTPQDLSLYIDVYGAELDLTSSAFQNEFLQLWNNTLQSYLESTLLSVIDESGSASATAEGDHPASLNFGGAAYFDSTAGVFPIQFQTAGNITINSTLIATNLEPFPFGTNFSTGLIRNMDQQGLTANVSCQEVTLNASSDPPLFRTSHSAQNITFATISTDCNGTVDSTTAITTANDTFSLIGCETVEHGQRLLKVIIDGEGLYNLTFVCTIAPFIDNTAALYTEDQNQVIASQDSDRPLQADPGPFTAAIFSGIKSAFAYGQGVSRNEIGDSLLAIFQEPPSEVGDIPPTFTELLEAYLTGMVEFITTALKTELSSTTGPFGGNPPAEMLIPVNGTAEIDVVGWQFHGVTSILVLLPILFFGLLSIVIAVGSQLLNRGMPIPSAEFDMNDPWQLMAAAAAGGMGRVFPREPVPGDEQSKWDDLDAEKGWTERRVMLGPVNGRGGFVEVV
ncbi:hypothetical protein HMN09_00214100 [Mycena chlorophos]|uniref:Uncharacterized protein n=1 Tax=Mycena chlorophos TaxID=658473 RepID=A0A8H6WNI1_MYCCL|nr:hypothetical protein HMN09_00214100 [Mycena chlorophos]